MKPGNSLLNKASSRASSRKYSFSVRGNATKSILINLEELAEPFIAVPPDGGWGWVVVAASFITMFCADGIGYCFAVFFDELSEEFDCEITEVALVTSLIGGFYYISGPLTCSAINRLGFQVIAVAGGALAFVTFLAASFTTTLLSLLILVGVLGGTAFNLIYTPSIIAIGFYFERWRALAIAICCCGSSLGVMCYPIILIHVFEGMTWRTKFQIIAGVYGVCGILGLTFKPIKATKLERNVQFGEVSRIESDATVETETELKFGAGIAGFFQRFRNALFPTISEVSVYSNENPNPSRAASKTSSLGYSFFMREHEDEAMSTYMQPELSTENIANHRSIGDVRSEEDLIDCHEQCRKCCAFLCKPFPCFQCCTQSSEASYTNVNRPLYRDDIFYSGSVFLLPQYAKADSHVSVPVQKGVPSLAYTLSVSRAPTQRDVDQQYQCVCCPEAFVRVLATMLHFQMLKSPAFICLLISGYLSLLGTFVVFTYISQNATEKGVDPKVTTMLLSIIGISNTFGRAACGVVSCFPVLDANVISWITICLSGAVVAALGFAHSATDHIIISVLFGFNLASFAVLRAIIFVDLFGLENLTNCFGLNMIFQSLAAFSATPLANLILRLTDNFATVFIFTGVAIFTSGLMLIPLRCILKWENRKTKRVNFA